METLQRPSMEGAFETMITRLSPKHISHLIPQNVKEIQKHRRRLFRGSNAILMF